MAYTVHLVPSGREFTVEPNEPILDAALRAGLDLSYNCASGTCGECKARILSGRLGGSRFHDYSFSEAERQQGYVLLCSTCAAGDLMVEVNETADPANIPEQVIEAKVAKLEHRGEEHILLSVRTPRSRTLRFLAGQAVDVIFSGGIRKRLAVASCPCNGMILQFHLSERSNSGFTRYVSKHARVGTPVEIRGPYGRFTLDEESSRPVVAVAWGTGFAPIKSIIEHAIALELPQPIRLFWSTAPGAQYLANYCRSLVDALDRFAYVPLSSENPSDTVQSILSGVPEIREADIYLASEEDEALDAARRFMAAGVLPGRIFVYPG